MPRQRAPEVGEFLHKAVVLGEPCLEVALRMQIDHHRHPLIQNHLHRGVEIAKVLRGNLVGPVARHQWLRIHAQAHMIESHGLDQSDIFGRRPALEVFLRVPALVINLREPLAGINSMSQTRHPRCWNG